MSFKTGMLLLFRYVKTNRVEDDSLKRRVVILTAPERQNNMDKSLYCSFCSKEETRQCNQLSDWLIWIISVCSGVGVFLVIWYLALEWLGQDNKRWVWEPHQRDGWVLGSGLVDMKDTLAKSGKGSSSRIIRAAKSQSIKHTENKKA